MMTNPAVIKWLAKAPKVSAETMPRHIKMLSKIAATNPQLQEDILDYLQSITIGDSEKK
jgi:hypothetical protein